MPTPRVLMSKIRQALQLLADCRRTKPAALMSCCLIAGHQRMLNGSSPSRSDVWTLTHFESPAFLRIYSRPIIILGE